LAICWKPSHRAISREVVIDPSETIRQLPKCIYVTGKDIVQFYLTTRKRETGWSLSTAGVNELREFDPSK